MATFPRSNANGNTYDFTANPPTLQANVAYPSYASDSPSAFIPQLWSPVMVEQFYPATVIGDLANTDYEGLIKQFGDSVVIRISPDIYIEDYEVGQRLVYQNPQSTTALLEINRAKSFSFALDAVDKYQSDLQLIEDWAETASRKMAVAVDQGILGDIYVDAHPTNQGANAGAISANINLGTAAAPLALDDTNVIKWIISMGQALDENNVPSEDRSLVLPAAITAMIKSSDLKDASITGDATTPMRNGMMGMIDRFKIYGSNNLSSAQVAPGDPRDYNIIACHKSALTFAAQMEEGSLVHFLNQETHGELARGLMVYGYEVIKRESLVWSVARVS